MTHAGVVRAKNIKSVMGSKSMKKVNRPWGYFDNLREGRDWHLKMITVKKGKRLSLQSHFWRDEIWVAIEGKLVATIGVKTYRLKPGKIVTIKRGTKHRLASKNGGKIIEINFGKFDENDIIRYEDDYGRIKK